MLLELASDQPVALCGVILDFTEVTMCHHVGQTCMQIAPQADHVIWMRHRSMLERISFPLTKPTRSLDKCKRHTTETSSC